MVVRGFEIFLTSFLIACTCFAEENKVKSGELTVLSEKKFGALLGDKTTKEKHEASGVVFVNHKIYVVSDNDSRIARIDDNIKEAKLLGNKMDGIGYEGITYDHVGNKFVLVAEAIDNNGKLNAQLSITDSEFSIEDKKWLKYNFQSDNKGFEGLTFVVKDNKTYILALCEGNDCEAGATSKVYGAGRIKVYEKKKNKLKYIASVRLPRTLEFIDYSGIDINSDNKLAISSQESSAIWVSTLDLNSWTIVDDGVVYEFPKDEKGNKLYCNIEGVSWITNNRVVTVSDARKSNQPKQCNKKDQSIHIVSIKFLTIHAG